MSKSKADKRLAQFPDVQGKNRDVGYGRPPVHTRFQKGQSGHPKGRPRSAALSDALRAALAAAPPGGQEEGVESHADLTALALIDRACRGDVAACKEIADRTEGKARQAVQLSYTQREMYERAVRAIMEKDGCTREEAIQAFGIFKPEALDLLDEE